MISSGVRQHGGPCGPARARLARAWQLVVRVGLAVCVGSSGAVASWAPQAVPVILQLLSAQSWRMGWESSHLPAPRAGAGYFPPSHEALPVSFPQGENLSLLGMGWGQSQPLITLYLHFQCLRAHCGGFLRSVSPGVYFASVTQDARRKGQS